MRQDAAVGWEGGKTSGGPQTGREMAVGDSRLKLRRR
jgi:hypothetical protein